jgi:hypothetical protein
MQTGRERIMKRYAGAIAIALALAGANECSDLVRTFAPEADAVRMIGEDGGYTTVQARLDELQQAIDEQDSRIAELEACECR